jgi:hypothetical protein
LTSASRSRYRVDAVERAYLGSSVNCLQDGQNQAEMNDYARRQATVADQRLAGPLGELKAGLQPRQLQDLEGELVTEAEDGTRGT